MKQSKQRYGWIAVSVLLLVTGGAVALHKGAEKERIPVTLRVDFGPAGKPAYEGELLVDRGSTPKDAVSVVFPIQSGSICCNTREISAINGVRAEPSLNRWWTCRIQGRRKGVSPFRTALRPGDEVSWIYVEQPQ